jgi:hypothetical protein
MKQSGSIAICMVALAILFQSVVLAGERSLLGRAQTGRFSSFQELIDGKIVDHQCFSVPTQTVAGPVIPRGCYDIKAFVVPIHSVVPPVVPLLSTDAAATLRTSAAATLPTSIRGRLQFITSPMSPPLITSQMSPPQPRGATKDRGGDTDKSDGRDGVTPAGTIVVELQARGATVQLAEPQRQGFFQFFTETVELQKVIVRDQGDIPVVPTLVAETTCSVSCNEAACNACNGTWNDIALQCSTSVNLDCYKDSSDGCYDENCSVVGGLVGGFGEVFHAIFDFCEFAEGGLCPLVLKVDEIF